MYVSCNSPFDHLSFPHDILKRQSSLKPQQVWFLCYWWKVAATFCQFHHNLLGWYHPFSECNLEKWKKCFFNHQYPILRGCVDLFLFWITKVSFIILAFLQTKIVKKRQYLGVNMLNKIWKHLSRLSSKIPESLSTRLSIFLIFRKMELDWRPNSATQGKIPQFCVLLEVLFCKEKRILMYFVVRNS